MRDDPSFASFVNSTHNMNEDQPEFEVVFNNEALTQILQKMGLIELTDLLEKPVFFNTELEQPISLLEAARKRFSDAILS